MFRAVFASWPFPRLWVFWSVLACFAGTPSSSPGAEITAVPLFDAEAVPLDKPVWFGEMPGRPGTFVILERLEGRVSLAVLADGKWSKSEFLKIPVQKQGEMGLLGIAFHPDFPGNRKYYLNYNPASGALATVIEEREAAPSFSKDSGKPPRRIIRIEQTENLNHKGGTLAFGPKDGFLYVGMGDGGEGVLAQDPKSLLGKFLRLDVNAPDSFRVPADNPFVGQEGVRPEIWAFGLRNPWKWSFDSVTGTLWAGDVGELAREEINRVERGANLGWPWREGSVCQEPDSCRNAGLTGPVAELGRDAANAIIGGLVFRGNPSSPLFGDYFFSDYGSGSVWAIETSQGGSGAYRRVIALSWGPVSFGTDARGNLYLVRTDPGMIYRLESPDLSGIRAGPGVPGALPPVLRARRGRPWNPGIAGSLEFHTLQGRRVLVFDTQDPSAILDIEAGLYLLRARESENGLIRPVWVE